MEAHRFRRDFLLSPRAGQDQPTRPEPSLPWIPLPVRENTSKVVPDHSPAEGFGARLDPIFLTIDLYDSRCVILILGGRA